MNWLIENWFLVICILCVLGCAVFAVKRFLNLPTDQQKEKVVEWLIWACIEAERELQSGTGQAKLRKVYNAFISIPAMSDISKIITFAMFSMWVSEALEKMKEMLINNKALAEYVYGDNADAEVAKMKKQLAVVVPEE